MYYRIITNFLIIVVGLSSVFGTEVDICRESNAPLPIFVDIKGCDHGQPCPLVIGEDAIIIMNFTAPVAVDTLKANVMAQLEGTASWVRLPMDENVCDNLINTHCPLAENELAVYKVVMPILKFFPQVRLRLRFSIRHNGGSEDLVCFAVNCIAVKL